MNPCINKLAKKVQLLLQYNNYIRNIHNVHAKSKYQLEQLEYDTTNPKYYQQPEEKATRHSYSIYPFILKSHLTPSQSRSS